MDTFDLTELPYTGDCNCKFMPLWRAMKSHGLYVHTVYHCHCLDAMNKNARPYIYTRIHHKGCSIYKCFTCCGWCPLSFWGARSWCASAPTPLHASPWPPPPRAAAVRLWPADCGDSPATCLPAASSGKGPHSLLGGQHSWWPLSAGMRFLAAAALCAGEIAWR